MEEIRFDVFLKGKSVDLVSLNEEIVEKTNWYNWFNDEEITMFMQKHYYPNTKSKQLDYYKNEIENSTTKLQLGILHKKDNILIGVISLSDIDFLNRKCEISGLIGEKNYQNMKYIVEACKLIIKHAFDQLNMHKVYGGTIIKELSLMLCRVLGFKEEGLKRSDVYKNGKYNDIYLIGLMKEEYCEKF